MVKFRKYLLIFFISFIAIGSSITYLSKGDINISIPSIKQEKQIEKILINEDNLVSDTKITPEIPPVSNKVDINTASIDELQIAPGIGPAKAEAIIEYRNAYGGFSSVDELIEVKGIGEKTLEKIKEYYCVSDK